MRKQYSPEEKHTLFNAVVEHYNFINGIPNVAWQLLFNYPYRDCALVALIDGIGLADRGEKGYCPTGLIVSDGEYAEYKLIADELNEKILGLTPKESATLICTTL